jgi:hypothetical protein
MLQQHPASNPTKAPTLLFFTLPIAENQAPLLVVLLHKKLAAAELDLLPTSPTQLLLCFSLFFSLLFLSYTHFSFTSSQRRRTRNEMMQLPFSSTTTTSNNQPPCCCCDPLTPLCTHTGNTRFRVIGFYVIYEMTPLSSAKSHLCTSLSLSLSLSQHTNTHTHTHPHLLHDAIVTPTFFQVLQLPISSSSSLDLSVPMCVC